MQFILRCFLLLCILIVILIDSEVIEYSLSKLLESLQINHQEVKFTSDSLKMTAKRITCFLFLAIFSHQFVDLCILLGCDYCEKICGLGPKRALTLIQKHRTIENVILHVNRKVFVISLSDNFFKKKLLSDEFLHQTHPVPLFWKYKEARKIFLDAPRTEPAELTWTEPDEEALVEFLCRTTHVRCVLRPLRFPLGLGNCSACVHGIFVARAGSVNGWRSSIKRGKVSERREKSSRRQSNAGRPAWRISLELQERGVV